MNISIIGTGAMGGAIARGLLANPIPGQALTLANPHTGRMAEFDGRAVCTTDNRQACRDADVVIVAVKPWILPGVLREIKDVFDPAGTSVIAVVAGISGRELTENLTHGGRTPSINLVMPNTAVSVGQSMTFNVAVCGDDHCRTRDIFSRLGQVMDIDEAHLPGAMALASCGIAYALRYVRAATEGGVELGFRASEAQAIVAQTVAGAAALLARGAHAEAEIDRVTTPGGFTIRGLNEMERAGFSTAVIQGLKASIAK